MVYTPKTQPYHHQVQALAACVERPLFALFMEQRTGKTKVALDKTAIQYQHWLQAGVPLVPPTLTPGIKVPAQQGCNALLVIAMPGRVHRNWVVNEVPAHLPDRIPRLAVVWDSGRVRYKPPKVGSRPVLAGPLVAPLEALLTFQGLSILAINGEAITTEAFRHYVARFLKARRVHVVADEHTLIMKTPGIARTKMMHAIARHPNAVFRTIMDGTPVGEGPLDLYAPFMFLDWCIFGFTSFLAFKHHFAKWEKKYNYTQSREYESLVEYQNLDELQAKMAPHSFRVLRKDCWDVPAKVYQTHSFQLSTVQRQTYDQLKEEFEAELSGQRVSAAHVLTRYLRLQQITSNFWPQEIKAQVHAPCKGEGCEGCDELGVTLANIPLRQIDQETNPRIKAAEEIFSLNPRPGIVWARFHEDIDQLMVLAARVGRNPVQYDGRVPPELKDAALDGFQAGLYDLFIGNQASGGRGIRLDRAEWMLYYSNDFSLLKRLQGEDRAEAQDRAVGTGIIDLVAEDTIDETIVEALRAKKKITDYVLKEKSTAWL